MLRSTQIWIEAVILANIYIIALTHVFAYPNLSRENENLGQDRNEETVRELERLSELPPTHNDPAQESHSSPDDPPPIQDESPGLREHPVIEESSDARDLSRMREESSDTRGNEPRDDMRYDPPPLREESSGMRDNSHPTNEESQSPQTHDESSDMSNDSPPMHESYSNRDGSRHEESSEAISPHRTSPAYHPPRNAEGQAVSHNKKPYNPRGFKRGRSMSLGEQSSEEYRRLSPSSHPESGRNDPFDRNEFSRYPYDFDRRYFPDDPSYYSEMPDELRQRKFDKHSSNAVGLHGSEYSRRRSNRARGQRPFPDAKSTTRHYQDDRYESDSNYALHSNTEDINPSIEHENGLGQDDRRMSFPPECPTAHEFLEFWTQLKVTASFNTKLKNMQMHPSSVTSSLEECFKRVLDEVWDRLSVMRSLRLRNQRMPPSTHPPSHSESREEFYNNPSDGRMYGLHKINVDRVPDDY